MYKAKKRKKKRKVRELEITEYFIRCRRNHGLQILENRKCLKQRRKIEILEVSGFDRRGLRVVVDRLRKVISLRNALVIHRRAKKIGIKIQIWRRVAEIYPVREFSSQKIKLLIKEKKIRI